MRDLGWVIPKKRLSLIVVSGGGWMRVGLADTCMRARPETGPRVVNVGADRSDLLIKTKKAVETHDGLSPPIFTG